MQITVRFADEWPKWSALRLARLLCDLQHLATVLASIDGQPRYTISLGQPFEPKYEAMITGDHWSSDHPLIAKTDAELVRIRKSSPLTVTIQVLCSAGSVAVVAHIARTVCRIIVELQNARRARYDADRAQYRAAIARLEHDKKYMAVRRALKTEQERATLDENMAKAMEGLFDGRHLRVEQMTVRLPRR